MKSHLPNALVLLMSTTLLGLAGCSGDAKKGRVIIEDASDARLEKERKKQLV